MKYNIKRESKATKLYRFYVNGIRYTCEAKSLSEARGKFHNCRIDKAEDFARGNKTTPRSKRKIPNVAQRLEVLNAFDVGVMLAHSGFDTVPSKVLKAFVTYGECRAARLGLHSV